MVLGVVALLAIVGTAVGCSSAETSGERSATTAEATAPVPSAPVEQRTPPADGGRMSGREWRVARAAIAGVDREVDDYVGTLQTRCAVLLQGVEVAEALACFDRAYAGVEDRVIVSVYLLGGLRPEVGQNCAKALGYAYNVLDGDLFRALRASKAALDSLDSLDIEPSRELRRQRRRWDHATLAVRQLCAPA